MPLIPRRPALESPRPRTSKPGRDRIMRDRASSILAALIAALMLLGPLGGARALDWPTRPIRVVVPFGASGVTDIVTRIVFDKVGQQLGQPVIIDNRPGAGGTIAID